jgi:acetaldehyde dehydrogenase (acetylating)
MASRLTIAEIALIAATRVALGAGLGLLVSNRLNEDQRKAAGIALAVVGGLTTIPLVLTVARRKISEPAELRSVA